MGRERERERERGGRERRERKKREEVRQGIRVREKCLRTSLQRTEFDLSISRK